MGSAGGEHDKVIDAKIGGLVWVRRRNGSWWPGKILSPHELPNGCAAVPKSGTPVKLLGKKGATVDWYNLEKSKRVKAFHCGEYEDCIEKARVSASHISKKGTRKARREDAIIHALELESALLGKSSSENGRGTNQLYDSTLELHNQDLHNSEVEFSFEFAYNEPKKLKTPNDSEEDVAVVKRMRGLEDLGVGVPSSLKRKRSQVSHEFSKRKNRHRPLTKVLECSTMLSSPLDQFPCRNSPCNGTALERKVSSFDADEAMNSISVEIKNEADCIGFLCAFRDPFMQQHEPKDDNRVQGDDESSENLFDVPLMSEDMPAVVYDASQRTQFGSGESIESGSTPYVHQISFRTEKSASDWQTKGKRNSRSRKLDTDDENFNSIASPRLLPHRLSRYTVNPKYDSTDFSKKQSLSNSCLYNVVVEVKSSYRPQHVPYISLMSKMNNLPITGYPLTVEVLEYGKSLLSESLNSTPKSTKSRKVGMLSKKTRKLSSLTGFSQVKKKPVKSCSLACIPLKIVFSRINAALSSSHRPLLPRLVEETNGT